MITVNMLCSQSNKVMKEYSVLVFGVSAPWVIGKCLFVCCWQPYRDDTKVNWLLLSGITEIRVKTF